MTAAGRCLQMKKKLYNIILILILFGGLSLLLYPTVSDYWNSLHQSKAIATYTETVSDMDNVEYKNMWKQAEEYNNNTWVGTEARNLTDEQKEEYESVLNIGGSGVMGYIDIPKINCTLPIYHGTDEGVLNVAVGHLEWSSLPVGGEGTHCVISGHRGLPSAKLFTNLDKLAEKDIFMLRVLDNTLTYEVDQILIVEPDDTSALLSVSGEDYCTLVTCTPYGINSHRLLVRGHRIENTATSSQAKVTADAVRIEPLIVAPIVAIPMLVLLFLLIILGDRKR